MKKKHLQLAAAIFGVVMFVWVGSISYWPISGQVIDAETKAPVEGAVVLVEWTKTHGIGEHWTDSYKVATTFTDKDGKFKLPGCYSLLVDVPHMTIYKKGYVAWSSRWIFPDRRNRTDFKWKDSVYELEHFQKQYSYIDHTDFISDSSSMHINFKAKKTFYGAFSWEDQMASKERDRKAGRR